MALRVKARVGDIFQIPIDDTRVGYGQVVMQPDKSSLFICIYSIRTRPGEQPDLDAVVQSEILLAGNTFDARIWHGYWPVVGNIEPNMATIALPNYKEGLPGRANVENLDRTRRRPATKEEEQILPFRSYVAPIRFEKALKALAGIGEWRPEHEDLKYERVLRCSSVIV